MQPMADSIVSQMLETGRRLVELGRGYLTLDRAGSTLSTGERQCVQLSRTVRNRTTGVLYVPSIGLHPSDVDGLLGVVRSLLSDGNSVVVVDHDVQVLREADRLIEIGPGSGRDGGTVLATGTVADLGAAAVSRIGGFLTGREHVRSRERATADEMSSLGRIG
jgi:excinuclease ABC subunit A